MKLLSLQSPFLKSALLAIVAIFSFSLGLQAQAQLPEEGYNFTRISGNSMLPVLNSGDVAVVYKDYPYKKLRVGDVVIIKSKEGYSVIHRIIRRYRGGLWVTKGDNNRYEDREVLSKKNFGGLALVDESIEHYERYAAKQGIESFIAADQHLVAHASSKGTHRDS